jgi:hypothetical protein
MSHKRRSGGFVAGSTRALIEFERHEKSCAFCRNAFVNSKYDKRANAVPEIIARSVERMDN